MEAVPFQILSIALSSFFFSLWKWYLYNKVQQQDYKLHILSQTSQLKCVKIQIAGGGMGALYMGNVCVEYRGCNLYQSGHFPTTKQSKLCQFDYNSLISNVIWPTYCAIHQEKSSRFPPFHCSVGYYLFVCHFFKSACTESVHSFVLAN